MQNKVYLTMDEAVADIPNGVTLMIPGFGGVGQPKNLVAALYRQGAKDLTGISNGAGGLNVLSPDPDAPPDMGTIIAERRVRKMICAFTAPTHPSRKTDFDVLYVVGKCDLPKYINSNKKYHFGSIIPSKTKTLKNNQAILRKKRFRTFSRVQKL